LNGGEVRQGATSSRQGMRPLAIRSVREILTTEEVSIPADNKIHKNMWRKRAVPTARKVKSIRGGVKNLKSGEEENLPKWDYNAIRQREGRGSNNGTEGKKRQQRNGRVDVR